MSFFILLPQIQFYGFANQAFRFGEVFSLIGHKVTEIIMSRGILRKVMENSPQLLLGREALMGGGINPIERQANFMNVLGTSRLLQQILTLLDGSVVVISLRLYAGMQQMIMELVLFVGQLNGLIRFGQCFLGSAEPAQSRSQIFMKEQAVRHLSILESFSAS